MHRELTGRPELAALQPALNRPLLGLGDLAPGKTELEHDYCPTRFQEARDHQRLKARRKPGLRLRPRRHHMPHFV